MHHESSMIANPPKLYTGALVTEYFAMPNKTVREAILSGNLRAWGKVMPPHTQGGARGIWVVTATQLAQWLIGRHTDTRIVVSSDMLDQMLSYYVDTLKRLDALPSGQAYLEQTPYEDIFWISNYAHHGGKTERR